MKKNILFIFLFLVFPLSVYADKLELKCQSGDNKRIACEIVGNSDKTITEINFKITSSKKISILNLNIGNGWKSANNSSNISITNEGMTGKFKIGEVIFTNPSEEEGYIGISSIRFKDSNNNEIQLDSIERTVPIPEDDSHIKYIIIDNYLIDFNPDVFEYTLKISNENSLNIKIVPEFEDTKYAIINNHDLENDSVIEIITNSNTKMSSTYKITIVKEVKESNKKILYVFIGIVTVIVIINLARIINTWKNKE